MSIGEPRSLTEFLSFNQERLVMNEIEIDIEIVDKVDRIYLDRYGDFRLI